MRTLADVPVALPSLPAEQAGPIYGGLPEGEGREAVYFACRACHALDRFTEEALPRE